MATETQPSLDVSFGLAPEHLINGILAGIVAGAVFGSMMGAGMMEMVAMMVGLEGAMAGWVVHSLISAIFAIGFVIVLSLDPVASVANAPSVCGVVGAVYGVIVWVVGAVILMPLIVEGTFMLNLDWMSLVGHIIWGIVLAVVYILLVALE